ncbi:MAG: hypothetical protein D6729_00220 [Deltaproteobacteria bacterium]|nr:MAG: hypothetical protein D6729_00220 [Deltaproteobacteria bacterium]
MRRFQRILAAACFVLFSLVAACDCGGAPGDGDGERRPDATKSTLEAESPVVADGVSTGRITATIVDAAGKPLPGVTVVFRSTRESDQITQPSGPTGDDGVARGAILSTEPGEVTLSATANDVELEAQAAVLFVEACGPGEARCDGKTCVDTESNVAHCGGCDQPCEGGPNAAPACVMGSCTLACDEGFADCDGDPSNGCEADLSSPEHCGRCGNACAGAPQASGQCADPASGRCGLACDPGFADCDGDPVTGCETSISTDSDCGACGNDCNGVGVAGGVGRCADPATATCAVDCDPGFGDCDGDPSNGCEAALDSAAACGSCAVSCAGGPNDVPFCADPATQTCGWRCNPGYEDCDPQVDGCETDVLSDANHCGGCGNACPIPANGTAMCSGGRCTFACSAGFADCNLDLGAPNGDGCETDLSQGDCGCRLSLTAATSTCLTAGSGARTAVYVELVDASGMAVSGATVTIDSPGLNWLGPVTESSSRPGTYFRVGEVLPASGDVVVNLSVSSAECGTDEPLRPVTISVADPVSAGPEGGTGGCSPQDGNVQVQVVSAEDGTPIEGAFVMVGQAEDPTAFHGDYESVLAGSPGDSGNTAPTDAAGRARFSDFGDALDGALTVTAGAPGRAYVSLVGIGASDVVLALPAYGPPPAEVVLDGAVTAPGYPTNNDNRVEAALVVPEVEMDFVARFDLAALFENNRTVDVSGGILCPNTGFTVASNIEVPDQSEVGCAVTGGTPWILTPQAGGSTDLFALQVDGSVIDLLNGGSALDLLAVMVPRRVGVLSAVSLGGDQSGLVLPADTLVSATMPVTLSGAPLGAVWALAVGDLDGLQGDGRLFIEGFEVAADSTALTATLHTADPTGAFANKSDFAVGLSTAGGALSLVMDRSTTGRAAPRTLDGFYAFPNANIVGREFQWDDVAGSGGADYHLARSELRRVTPTGDYTQHNEPFWIVYTPGGYTLPVGRRGFDLPTLPPSAPRAADGGYLVPGPGQFNEWFLALWYLGGLPNPADFDLAAHAFGGESAYLTKLANDTTVMP